MFKENSDSNQGAGAAEASMSSVLNQVKLSEEETVELTGSWNMMAALTLVEIQGFVMNPENLKKKMNVSLDEASVIINSLSEMNLLQEQKDGSHKVPELFFDESNIGMSDALNNSVKLKRQALDKLTSKDFFGVQFEAMSPKVINKYLYEIYGLVKKIAEESKSEADCEVYAVDYSFVKASGSRKAK
jgi:glutaredoxin